MKNGNGSSTARGRHHGLSRQELMAIGVAGQVDPSCVAKYLQDDETLRDISRARVERGLRETGRAHLIRT